MARKSEPETFFSEKEKQQLVQAIERAEKNTSGEIRVHLARACKKEVLKEAQEIFEELGMTKTAARNGILFFLSLDDHQFAILGDQGIHEKVQEEFWNQIRDELIVHFKREQFLEGLIAGIEKCGETLSNYFPYQKDDSDELSNQISES